MTSELDNVAAQLERLTKAIQDLQHCALTSSAKSDEWIGKAELAELTGAATVPGQSRWLEQRAIPHRVEFIGATTRRRIIVSRVHVREWLAGSQKPAGAARPNWASVR